MSIVQSLSKVLDPYSDGNFYHFKRLLDSFVMRNERPTLDFFYKKKCPELGRPYLIKMLLYAHSSFIQDAILNLMFLSAKNEITPTHKERFTLLLEMEFVDHVWQLIDSPLPVVAKGGAELITRIVEEARQVDGSHVIFMSAVSNSQRIQKLLERLRKGPGSSTINWKCHVEAIHSICVRSAIRPPRPAGFASLMEPEPELCLKDTRNVMLRLLGRNMHLISEIVQNMNSTPNQQQNQNES
jgi:hypothetical protein